LILTYSNLGLDVSSALLSDHMDLWFLSAKPFDAILAMSAKSSESALQSSLDRAAKYAIDALGCTLNATQLHMIRERSMPHMCTDEKDLTSEDKVRCLNNLCKQKGLQAMALRDIKLTNLEAVIHKYRNRIKIVLLQEIPEESRNHVQRKCHRLMLDTERSAELEGYSPGIHTIYFLEHFAQNWLGHALQMLKFVGLDPHSSHTKAGIKSKPSNLVNIYDELFSDTKSPWKMLLDKCNDYI